MMAVSRGLTRRRDAKPRRSSRAGARTLSQKTSACGLHGPHQSPCLPPQGPLGAGASRLYAGFEAKDAELVEVKAKCVVETREKQYDMGDSDTGNVSSKKKDDCRYKPDSSCQTDRTASNEKECRA